MVLPSFPPSKAALISSASSIAIRGRRRSPLERAPGEQAGGGPDQQEESGLNEETGPEVVEDEVVEQPGDAVHEEDQSEEDEDPRRETGDRAPQQGVELLGDLRLRELDLLANQDRGAVGDLETSSPTLISSGALAPSPAASACCGFGSTGSPGADAGVRSPSVTRADPR